MNLDSASLRIIDVNLNRCREGLRVVEEVARFILNDDELTIKLRSLRQSLQNLPADFPNWQTIIEARDIESDVGANRSLKDRINIEEVIHANCCRVEESFRVLEEFCSKGEIFQKLRFEVYEVEKDCLANANKKGMISS